MPVKGSWEVARHLGGVDDEDLPDEATRKACRQLC